MASIAVRVRCAVQLPVATAWGMDEPAQAQLAIGTQQLELAMMGHAQLADPRNPFRAARELKAKASALPPDQYGCWLGRHPGPQNGDPVEWSVRASMSNCLTSQAVWMDSSHGFPAFAMALRRVSGFRMQATRAISFGLR